MRLTVVLGLLFAAGAGLGATATSGGITTDVGAAAGRARNGRDGRRF